MYHKRINADIRHFKNAYPNVKIYQKDNNIVLENIFQCLIKLSDQYPFTQPDIYIINEKCDKVKLPYWTPIMDLRTIYAHVLSAEYASDKSPVSKVASIADFIDNDKDDFKKFDNHDLLNEKDPMFYVVDYESIHQLKKFYPNVQITDNHHEIVFGIEDIEIFVSLNQVYILEMGNKWPNYLTPSYDKNVLTIVDQVMVTKKEQEQSMMQVKYLKKSLEHYFDCVIYNPYHQTFIINCQQGLIIISLSNFIPIKITMYHQGEVTDLNITLEDLGKMIYDEINQL